MFGLGQTKKKKETEAKIRQTKAEEWNYKGRIDQVSKRDGSTILHMIRVETRVFR